MKPTAQTANHQPSASFPRFSPQDLYPEEHRWHKGFIYIENINPVSLTKLNQIISSNPFSGYSPVFLDRIQHLSTHPCMIADFGFPTGFRKSQKDLVLSWVSNLQSMQMCMYISKNIYIHIYLCIYIYYTNMYIYTYILHVCVYINISIHVCTYTCIYVYIYTYMCIQMYIYIYVYIYINTYNRTYIDIYIYIHTQL